MKKTSLPPKSPEQLEKDKIASLLDELYKIKDRKTRIRLREKKVRTRLEKCVHKVLRSLTCSYPQDSEKNFSDEMRKMKFQFLSPFQGSKGKVHAEMNILQFIFDKTSKFADIKEPIYIGTSLLACFDCNSIYNQVNKSNLIFEYRGTSNWRFRCWQEADFMGKLGLDINVPMKLKSVNSNSVDPSDSSVKSGQSESERNPEEKNLYPSDSSSN